MPTHLQALRTTRDRDRAAVPDPLSPLARTRASSGGQALDRKTQNEMSARFGHDFSQVRIHTDARAEQSAQAIGAGAYTVGSDIFFNDGFYDPRGQDGGRLLAHELTHVVQQDRHGGAADGLRGVSDPDDASEREATALSNRVSAGQRVQVQAAPTAVASRGVLDWVEDQVSDTLSGALDGAKYIGSAVADEVETDASNAYAGMKVAAGGIRKGEEAVNEGIDWLEDEEKEGTSWLVDQAKGDPQMEQWANAGKTFLDNGTEAVGGVGRGVTGLVGGVGQMVVDPVDTAKGVESMAEHIPGVGDELKQTHSMIDVMSGKKTQAQADAELDPRNAMDADGEYWKQLGGHMLDPYRKQWDQGKYADVAGHGLFDIGSLFFGAGEVGEGAKVAEVAGDLGRAGEVGADAAKISDANKAADLARAGEAKVAGGGRGMEPPGGVPPSGGGGAGGGKGPQSIPEMIQAEMAREHAGAHPLNPQDFAGGGSRPVAPPATKPVAPPATKPVAPPQGSGTTLGPLRSEAEMQHDSMVKTMKDAGMSAEEAEKTARDLAGTEGAAVGKSGQLSPAKQAELNARLATNRGRRH